MKLGIFRSTSDCHGYHTYIEVSSDRSKYGTRVGIGLINCIMLKNYYVLQVILVEKKSNQHDTLCIRMIKREMK